jgi:WD40 repeat protein
MCDIPEPGGTALSRESGLLVTVGDDGMVKIWATATGSPLGEPLGGQVASVASINDLGTPTDPAYCIIRSNGHADLWEPDRGGSVPLPWLSRVSALARITEETGAATVLAVADTAGTATVMARDGTALTEPTRIGDGAVVAIQALPVQPLQVASADRTGNVTLWLPHGPNARLSPLAGHAGTVRSLCLLPREGQDPLLASAGDDGSIRLWSPGTWQPHIGPLTGHDGCVWSLALIPAADPRPVLLASAGADATVRVWNPTIGVAVGDPLVGHTDQVRAVISAVTRDGRTILVSGSHDGTIRLWHPTTGEPIHAIPLGVPVHALLQQQPEERSRERTDDGASIIVGLRTGVLTLDLNRSVFPAS